MRKIYNYYTIRYYPHVLSDEFVNVGVVLTSGKNTNRILTEEEARHLHCSALIGETKKFLGIVEYLNDLSSRNRLLESNHYFHNFRFSEEKKIASEKLETKIIDELFEDYIGFKISIHEKSDEKALIVEQSIKLVESSAFRNHIRIHQSKESKEFDFELESIRHKIMHHSNLGKSSLKQDVTRMVMATPSNKKNNDRYDFLDLSGDVDYASHYIKKLEQNFVDSYPYKYEDQIAKYLEGIAS